MRSQLLVIHSADLAPVYSNIFLINLQIEVLRQHSEAFQMQFRYSLHNTLKTTQSSLKLCYQRKQALKVSNQQEHR